MAQSNEGFSVNVMESLVEEELERQLKTLPARTIEYIQPAQVRAYALNRLPALYATSDEGVRKQRLRGKAQLQDKITAAVHQGFSAVQQDPLRRMTHHSLSENESHAQAALHDLQELLQRPDLNWDNVVRITEQALVETRSGKVTWRRISETDYSLDWDSGEIYRR
jgi:hypothetical protein